MSSYFISVKYIFLFLFIASTVWSCSEDAPGRADNLAYHEFTSYADFKKTLIRLTEITDVTDRDARLATFFDSLKSNHQIPFAWGDSVAFLYKGNATSVVWAGDFNG